MGLGVWMIMMLVPSYAEALGRTKADVAAVYFIGRKTYPKNEILFNMNVIALASSGLFIALTLWQLDFLYHFLFHKTDTGYLLHLLVLLTQIPLQFLYLNYSYFHIAHENVAVQNRMVIIRAWVNSAIVICLLLLSDLQLWSMIISGVASFSLALVYGWWKVDRTSWDRTSWNGTLSWDMIRYGANFYLAGILGHLREQGTRTITVAFLMPGQIAFLGQAQSLSRMLQNIPNALNTILYPRLSRSNIKNAVEVSTQAFRISLILLSSGGLLLGFIAEPLITLIYGPAYKTTASVIQLILPGVVIYGTASTLESYFNGSGRAHLIPKIQILPVALQLAAAFLMVQRWGLTGAAVALSVGFAVYGFALCIVFLGISRTPVGNMLPTWVDIKILLSFLKQTFISRKNGTAR